MELRQLRAFLEVVDHGHFGRAASRLNLTQPALTQRIQSLERELGVQLLHRTAREVRLTPAGELLLPYARSLVRVEDRAELELSDYVAGIRGRLRIAYQAVGELELPGRIVAEFRRRYETVELETSSNHSQMNLDRLIEGTVDAAFISVAGAMQDGVRARRISHDILVVAIPEGHRLAGLDPVPVTALVNEPLIMIPAAMNPGYAASLMQWLARRMGAQPNVVAYEPVDQAIEAVAKSGSALTFIGEGRAVRTTAPGIVYHRMSPSPLIDLAIAYLSDDPTPTVANLLRIVDEVAGPGPGPLPEGSELIELESA